jgi:hypothetical protein
MRRKRLPFTSTDELENLIALYFTEIENKKLPEGKTKKSDDKAMQTHESKSGPVTISGLALYLGFSSREAFEKHEAKGKFSDQLKRARLRIMADYEKKLHVTSSTGAIFALKSMGWNERPEKPADETASPLLKVEIIQSGPQLAASEQEVIL